MLLLTIQAHSAGVQGEPTHAEEYQANPNAASVPACSIGLDLRDQSIRFRMLNGSGEVTRGGRFRLHRGDNKSC